MRKQTSKGIPARAGRPRPPGSAPAGRPYWMLSWKVMLALWVVILAVVWLALRQHVDAAAVAGGVLVVGLLSNAFAWLLGIVSLVPIVGPLVVKVLSVGFIWLINGVGYLVSLIAIKRGYSKDVLTYRGVTIALMIGIIIGFVLGRLI